MKENKGSQFSYLKFTLMGAGLLLIIYGKILWPVIFGRMQNEGMSFMVVVKDESAHATAFVVLVFCSVAGIIWAYLKDRANQ